MLMARLSGRLRSTTGPMNCANDEQDIRGLGLLPHFGEGGQLNVSRWFQNASEEVPMLVRSIGGIQKPQIATPEGIDVPVALLDPSDQAKIPLGALKPELLHLPCHDEDDEDPPELATTIRKQMGDNSYPSGRGSPEPPNVYLGDVDEDGVSAGRR